ncbi:zinc finger protein BALDIBIS [Cannabis sativa]|uniref:zinc finger protein BALDIBIS n=1 Tax=Cannabis sativa TaxID=3483 RepID=UPI0029CA8152|nr:zinc finger protein BALDIBIS [Cannabis sativa]
MISDQDIISVNNPSSTINRGFVQEPNLNPNPNPNNNTNPSTKKKRNLPGNPDPDAEVIALSPKSLMATNRFLCEICNKGFQRDQNLQLHRRGHNLPWKLRQRSNKDVIRKKVYVCPEKTCVHHDPSRALGDLTGIKKHFSRKHGEKKWKCEKCSKKYAVQSDWKAHTKICGTREYKCDCGTLFSRKDSFITHRAFCDALAEENARFGTTTTTTTLPTTNIPNFIINNNNNPPHQTVITASNRITHQLSPIFSPEFGSDTTCEIRSRLPVWLDPTANSTNVNPFMTTPIPNDHQMLLQTAAASNIFGQQHQWMNMSSSSSLSRGLKEEEESRGNNNNSSTTTTTATIPNNDNNSMMTSSSSSLLNQNNNNNNIQLQQQGPTHMSATALLQKAAQMGSTRSNPTSFNGNAFGLMSSLSSSNNSQKQVLFRQPQSTAENNFNDLVNSLQSSSDNTNENNNGNSVLLSSLDLQQQQQQPPPPPPPPSSANNENDEHGNMTRDFLGVGGVSTTTSNFFQQELAKFASMGSTMNLSQYNGHH